LIKKLCKTILAGAAALLFLSSCEDVELWDFVIPPEPVFMTFHLSPDDALTEDSAIPGLLMQELHTETLGDPVTETEIRFPEGYVCAPLLPGLDAGTAEAALAEAGVTCTVERRMHPLEAGVVYAVEYAGAVSGGMHYINPAVPVCLYVSADKPDYPEATAENTVYLTFDDGPTAEGTVEILDILDSYGIKGTFFLMGDEAEKYPDAVKAIYSRGHDVACHSMSHKYNHIYASAANLMAETDEWVGLMESYGVDFGTVPKLFRYPGGSSSQYFSKSQLSVMNGLLADRGFRVYDWNIVANDALLFQCPAGMSAYDYIKKTFAETYQARKGTSSPKILLLHETVAETRVVLPWIIEYLIEDGCTFAPLSRLTDWWTFSDEGG